MKTIPFRKADPEDVIIEYGIPIPLKGSDRVAGMRKKLTGMKIGGSFMWHADRSIYEYAKRAGVKITGRKINGQGVRFWRIK